jgi:hypothetical protein
MDLEARWLSPFSLRESKTGIYAVVDADQIPTNPGVYVFARTFGDSVSPLYIGKAINLRSRIDQQLNNLKLMRAIEQAQNGNRMLYIAEFQGKGGQNPELAITIIEAAFINAAMVEGFELINIKGTKPTTHSISSTGNREGRSWMPDTVIRFGKVGKAR